MHVEFSFSHVESMSNFGLRGHFSTWAAEYDVEKSMEMSVFVEKNLAVFHGTRMT
jgi:hypothetical protein